MIHLPKFTLAGSFISKVNGGAYILRIDWKRTTIDLSYYPCFYYFKKSKYLTDIQFNLPAFHVTKYPIGNPVKREPISDEEWNKLSF